MVEATAYPEASKGTTQARLGVIAGVVYPLCGVDPRALAETMAAVLGGQLPLSPKASADPFEVLQQFASALVPGTSAVPPPPSQRPWLLITTELAAHYGPGASWCDALAAFRRPLLLVAAPQAGWEGQARAYGALARQSKIPLLGVASHGEPHAPNFDPALELGLSWLGHLPIGNASSIPAWKEEHLWLLRERLWFRWQYLCRTEQVTAWPTRGGESTSSTHVG